MWHSRKQKTENTQQCSDHEQPKSASRDVHGKKQTMLD
jgi:hypothetical protein